MDAWAAPAAGARASSGSGGSSSRSGPATLNPAARDRSASAPPGGNGCASSSTAGAPPDDASAGAADRAPARRGDTTTGGRAGPLLRRRGRVTSGAVATVPSARRPDPVGRSSCHRGNGRPSVTGRSAPVSGRAPKPLPAVRMPVLAVRRSAVPNCPRPTPAVARPRERSPAATSRANASGPRAVAVSHSVTRSARSGVSSPLWSTRPATRRIAPSAQVGQRLLVQAREDDDLERALQVFHRRHAHRLPALRHDRAEARHDAADDHPLLVEGLVAQIAGVGGHVAADLVGHRPSGCSER